MTFRKKIQRWFKVIDADETDLRFTDPRNVIYWPESKREAGPINLVCLRLDIRRGRRRTKTRKDIR